MNQKTFVYISSWSHGTETKGLGVYELNPDDGNLKFIELVDTDVSFNMTFIDKKKALLYAVNEAMTLPEMRAAGGGQIYVYRIDTQSGRLSFIDKTPTLCTNPSWVALDPSEQYVVVSNHAGSSAATKVIRDAYGNYTMEIVHDDSTVELFEVKEDGTLGKLLDVVKHYGDGPERRQVIPHPHCAVNSPDGSLYAVCDKGNDTIRMYKIDQKNRKLTVPGAICHCEAGSLPRYGVFHPEKPYFYNNNENTGYLSAYRYDLNGNLSFLGNTNVISENYRQGGTAKIEQQGICISRDGKHIYDIVRGTNTIAVLQIDSESGALTKIQDISIEDSWPRGCALTEDAGFLIVCGRGTGRIFAYKVNKDGTLNTCNIAAEQSVASYVSTWTV